jgi:hypothetical protein
MLKWFGRLVLLSGVLGCTVAVLAVPLSTASGIPPFLRDIPVLYDGKGSDVTVESAHCARSRDGGCYELIGELRNSSDAPITAVHLAATLSSDCGASVSEARGRPLLDVLAPGEPPRS